MKLAYMVATPEVGHSEITAIQGEPEETLAEVRATGYTGVEFLVRDPSVLDHGLIERAAARSGLDVPAVCTGEVYGEDGLSFADPDAARRRLAVDRMLSAMELAARFGAMVNVGRLRGRLVEEVPAEQTFEWIREALAECSRRFPDTPILIEPVNHHYANCLLTTEETMRFVEALGMPSVHVMLDLVHMLVEGEDPAVSLARAGKRLLHYHVSDSDRLPAGDGEYDIATALDQLEASGYRAYVTVETFQRPDGRSAMQRSYRHLAALRSWQT